MARTILLVDDDEHILRPVGRYLAKRGKDWKVLTARNGEEAIRILDSEKIDLVLSDLRMPAGDGIDLLAYVASHHPALPVVVMSGYVMEKDVEALAHHGHLKCLRKPMGPAEMYDAVVESLESSAKSASLESFSLAGILQLLEIEQKTCLVKITRDTGQSGSFFFVRGRMQRTECGSLRGNDAALEMLTWEHPSVRVKPLHHMKDAQLGPDHPLAEVLTPAGAAASEPASPPESPQNQDDASPKGRGVFPTATGQAALKERDHEVSSVLFLTSLLIIYFATRNLGGGPGALVGSTTRLSAMVLLNGALFLWTMGLLWAAHRRWRAAYQARANGSTQPAEARGETPADERLPARRVATLPMKDERLQAAVASAETAARERERALGNLEAGYERLQEAESLHDSLMHMVVHDMSPPLAAIESHLLAIRGEPTSSDDARAALDAALVRTREMGLMVDSLRDADRLKTGRSHLRTRSSSIKETINIALCSLGSSGVTGRIHVSCDAAAERFIFDPEVVQRVLANLVANAVRYDQTGDDITVEVTARDAWITVVVADRGPGVPDERREDIFRKFGGAAGPEASANGSSGLGLTYCRLAVEAHGGRIGVSPRPDGGSRFWFSLPAAPQADGPAAPRMTPEK